MNAQTITGEWDTDAVQAHPVRYSVVVSVHSDGSSDVATDRIDDDGDPVAEVPAGTYDLSLPVALIEHRTHYELGPVDIEALHGAARDAAITAGLVLTGGVADSYASSGSYLSAEGHAVSVETYRWEAVRPA